MRLCHVLDIGIFLVQNFLFRGGIKNLEDVGNRYQLSVYENLPVRSILG